MVETIRWKNERFTQAEVIKRERMMEEFNLILFEEPLSAEDLLGHMKIKAHTSTIALSAHGLGEVHAKPVEEACLE